MDSISLSDVLVYDVEIVRAIPSRNEQPVEGIEYCGGWDDKENMGIAVVAAYDFGDKEFRIFLEDNLADLEALAANRLPVGWNNSSFDGPLMRASGLTWPSYEWDMLQALRQACPPHTRRRAGRKLDTVAQANLGEGKKGVGGAMAPVAWQQGRRGSVIDYCLIDAIRTTRLVQRVPNIIDPVVGAEVAVRAPWLDGEYREEVPYAV